MNLLVIYVLAVLILIGVSFIVTLNFWRYRYEHDLTPLFILLFIIAFVATIILTFSFVTAGAFTTAG